jgi:hypothetical protein
VSDVPHTRTVRSLLRRMNVFAFANAEIHWWTARGSTLTENHATNDRCGGNHRNGHLTVTPYVTNHGGSDSHPAAGRAGRKTSRKRPKTLKHFGGQLAGSF